MEPDLTYFPPPTNAKLGDCYADYKSRAIHFFNGTEWDMIPEAELVECDVVKLLTDAGYPDNVATDTTQRMINTLIKTRITS